MKAGEIFKLVRHQAHLDLSDAQIVTLISLASHLPNVWPGVPRLARRSGKSVRTVRTILADLEHAGLLRRIPRFGESSVEISSECDLSPLLDLLAELPDDTDDKKAEIPGGFLPGRGKKSVGDTRKNFRSPTRQKSSPEVLQENLEVLQQQQAPPADRQAPLGAVVRGESGNGKPRPAIVDEMIGLGVEPERAQVLGESYTEAKIRAALDHTRQRGDAVEHKAEYFEAALEKGCWGKATPVKTTPKRPAGEMCPSCGWRTQDKQTRVCSTCGFFDEATFRRWNQ